jgi:hypothetical protein
MNVLAIPLLFPERAPNRRHSDRETRFLNEGIGPDRVHHLGLRYQFAGMAHQVEQAIEGTGLQRKFLAVARQNPVDVVDTKNIKFVNHVTLPVKIESILKFYHLHQNRAREQIYTNIFCV